MKNYIFDIETAPLPETDIAHLAPKFEAPANYKDPEKIAAHIAEQKVEWFKRGALSPLTGTVAAIGVLDHADNVSIGLTGDTGRTEAIVIAEFWDFLAGRLADPKSQIIGFNIFRFDLPFLIRRSWKLGLKTPLGIMSGRYFAREFIDLMEVWQLGNREERVSLDNLCKYLGVGMKSGSGADFYKLPSEQQRKYLTDDLTLTGKCVKKLLL